MVSTCCRWRTAPTPLARLGDLRYATWSGDGTRIAYASTAGGIGLSAVRVVTPADPTTDHLVTAFPAGSTVFDLSWSPEADVVLATVVDANRFSVWQVDVDTGASEVLVPTTADPTGFPAWLAKARGVVVERDDVVPGQAITSSALYLADTALTEPSFVRVTDLPGFETEPDVSHNGKEVVFSNIVSGQQSDLGVLDLDTGAVRWLENGPAIARSPDWQPYPRCGEGTGPG